MNRLCAATLERLPQAVKRPSYDRRAVRSGVVHMGLGAFQRAHQAPVFEALAESGDFRWGIVGASLRSPSVHELLSPQDCLYSLAVEDGAERRTSVLGILKDVIVARRQPQRLVSAIASPEAQIVTVTVTEKGYRLDPASGSLIVDDPDVQADLLSLDQPQTLAGYLVAGLRRRKEEGLHPITMISCDNISGNGEKLRSSTLRIAQAHDQALADWIEAECRFPNTMVDRIVPATKQSDIDLATVELGLTDLAAIRTEPFSQWVIEDCFAGERPELERAGIQFTSDVAPWEEAKLRLLNGAHSGMAYLGGLGGIATVHAFVSESWGRAFVELLWDELRTTLEPPPQLDLNSYCASLMHRFGNSALRHRLEQIAMDGSQKIPQRLLPAAITRLERGQSLDAIALIIAAWIRWQEGRADSGHRFEVADPLASVTSRCLNDARTVREKVRALLSLSSVFPSRLQENGRFEDAVVHGLDELERLGALPVVQQFVLERAERLPGRAPA